MKVLWFFIFSSHQWRDRFEGFNCSFEVLCERGLASKQFLFDGFLSHLYLCFPPFLMSLNKQTNFLEKELLSSFM